MAQNPSQALPITAAQVSVSAALSGVWCVADGFIGTPDVYGLPGLLSTALVTDGGARTAALAIGFTGLITTAANRVAETNCLGKMSSAEASVILATEPLWAGKFPACARKRLGEVKRHTHDGVGPLSTCGRNEEARTFSIVRRIHHHTRPICQLSLQRSSCTTISA